MGAKVLKYDTYLSIELHPQIKGQIIVVICTFARKGHKGREIVFKSAKGAK